MVCGYLLTNKKCSAELCFDSAAAWHIRMGYGSLAPWRTTGRKESARCQGRPPLQLAAATVNTRRGAWGWSKPGRALSRPFVMGFSKQPSAVTQLTNPRVLSIERARVGGPPPCRRLLWTAGEGKGTGGVRLGFFWMAQHSPWNGIAEGALVYAS